MNKELKFMFIYIKIEFNINYGTHFLKLNNKIG